MGEDALATLFPLGGPASALRSGWQRLSAEASWAHPADWWDPAVDALAEAVADGRDATVPAELLGVVRAQAGVGLAEGLDDLSVPLPRARRRRAAVPGDPRLQLAAGRTPGSTRSAPPAARTR